METGLCKDLDTTLIFCCLFYEPFSLFHLTVCGHLPGVALGLSGAPFLDHFLLLPSVPATLVERLKRAGGGDCPKISAAVNPNPVPPSSDECILSHS